MKIALVQVNPIIGDFAGNLGKIIAGIEEAESRGCELAVFPELSLCGYPPQDLLEREAFLTAHDRALTELTARVGDMAVIVGALEQRDGPGKPLYNSAVLIEGGKVTFRTRKQLLPTYDVFDETRYFEAGGPSLPIPFRGLRLGLSICEDIWYEPRHYASDPLETLYVPNKGSEIDLLINISASPYYHGKLAQRDQVFASLCRKSGVPLLYVNQVGGQDSLIFDGHSMVVAASGKPCRVARGFAEDLLLVDTEELATAEPVAAPADSMAMVLEALTMGVRDYLRKTGFRKAVLGLSGGIDSALTAAVACRALGPENVLCVAMPSPYTSQASIDDARELAENFGCDFQLVPIEKIMASYRQTMEPLFTGLAEDVTEQNIQARIRGNILMALSNKFGSLLLSTGNKSEMAVGYCTLYGDMSGGLAVLADVPKQMVYALSWLFNLEETLIPERIITRPPTAELKPDQFDQDDLPAYEILDPILTAYLEEHLGVDEIVARGFERKIVEDVVRRIKINEYKRKQAPVSLKVTTKAFGHGRRYPVVQRFRE